MNQTGYQASYRHLVWRRSHGPLHKHIDTSPRFLAVDLERQLLPGTFEHALNYLVDHRLDLSRFDARYKNDLTGASAYPPAMLLKVVLFAYSRGIVGSRDIERACREHVEAIAALCTADTLITTDAGYHSDANLKALAEQDRPALIAGNQMRKRDERFKDQAKYKAQPDPLYDKAHPKKAAGHYRSKDFDYDADAGTYVCPAGKSLYQNGANCNHNGHLAVRFQGGRCAIAAPARSATNV